MTKTERRYCRNCKWFHAKRARGSNAGECAEPYWQTVEYIRTCRTATMCCTRWKPKTEHTALSDDDLAEADRQARKIKEERR